MQPSEDELALNPGRLGRKARVDWEQQFQRSLGAFDGTRFIVLVDDRQLIDLDAEVELRPDTEIVFLKLLPHTA